MADSIAKLSVIITGDTSPLARNLRAGGEDVRSFARRVESGGGSMINFSRGVGLASKGVSAFRGNLFPLIGALSSGGPLIAGGVAAAGTLALIARQAISAADAAAVHRNSIAAQVAELQRLQGVDSRLTVGQEDTVAGEWERLKSATTSVLGNLAEITGLHQAAVNETRTWRQMMEAIRQATMTDEMREREASLKRQSEFIKEQKRLIDEQAAAEKKANEEREKMMAGLRTKAASITESLRTPGEIFADTVAELNNLFQLGLINSETLQRGMAKAREDARQASRDASDATKRFQAAAFRPIGAAERFTAEGVRAANEAKHAREQLEVAKKSLAAEKEQTSVIKEGFRKLQEKKPVALNVGAF